MSSNNKKGQIFVPDFIASVGLFAAILVFTGVIWNAAVVNSSSDYDERLQQNKYTLDLLKTSGSPSNWNETNVEIIGLAESNSSKISGEKFLEFKNISGNRKKKLLRAQEFLLEIRRLDGSVAEYKGKQLMNKTSEIPENQTVYSSKEYVTLKKQKAEVATEMVYSTWQR